MHGVAHSVDRSRTCVRRRIIGQLATVSYSSLSHTVRFQIGWEIDCSDSTPQGAEKQTGYGSTGTVAHAPRQGLRSAARQGLKACCPLCAHRMGAAGARCGRAVHPREPPPSRRRARAYIPYVSRARVSRRSTTTTVIIYTAGILFVSAPHQCYSTGTCTPGGRVVEAQDCERVAI
jgi:hypothetical protein